ncbi:MAG: Flp family type IVb pilin [Actinobacteria bacterium]|nr:Flp family type IVb pilin [Actinomycetota bacterium]
MLRAIVVRLITLREADPAGERGATMVECALLVALIALVVVVALGPLGTAISGLFDDAGTTVSSVAG